MLVVSALWSFYSQVPICSLEQTSHGAGCRSGGPPPSLEGKSLKSLVSAFLTASSISPWLASWQGERSEFGGFSLPNRHSQPRPSKPQSVEHQHGSISAHHHGNPRLPSQAGLLVGPTAQLFANSQDFAYSVPRIPGWTCRPPPPSRFFWTACPAPCSAPLFPGKALEIIPLSEAFLKRPLAAQAAPDLFQPPFGLGWSSQRLLPPPALRGESKAGAAEPALAEAATGTGPGLAPLF